MNGQRMEPRLGVVLACGQWFVGSVVEQSVSVDEHGYEWLRGVTVEDVFHFGVIVEVQQQTGMQRVVRVAQPVQFFPHVARLRLCNVGTVIWVDEMTDADQRGIAAAMEQGRRVRDEMRAAQAGIVIARGEVRQ
jgi:hypothetical protein